MSSPPDNGLCPPCLLGLAAGRECPPVPADHPQPSPPAEIVVLDPDPHWAATVVQWLQHSPRLHCAAVLTTIEAALWELPLRDRPPDIILMEYSVGGWPADHAVSGLKRLLPEAEVVIHTANPDPNRALRAIHAGASGIVLKTAHPAELLRALDLLEAGGSPLDPRIARYLLTALRQAHTPSLITRPAPPVTPPQTTAPLTAREQQVFGMLSQGHPYKQIALTLQVGYNTIKTHVDNLYRKLNIHSRKDLTRTSHHHRQILPQE